MKQLTNRLYRRKVRVSSNIHGTSERPRVAIHRTNKFIFAQAIDDVAAKTLASATSKLFEKPDITKTIAATQAGVDMGDRLMKANVKAVVIDRSRFHYQGRVAAFVEGLRTAGIHV
ncbi:MAG: 50S ribosomal protein L18 [Candidatus Roizmanbacteria bacterium]